MRLYISPVIQQSTAQGIWLQHYACDIETDEDGRFVVKFPDLPGCLTDGKTLNEAIKNALDALGLYLHTKEEFDKLQLANDDKDTLRI